MAVSLTDAEIVDALQLLGLPARVDAVFSYQGDSAILRDAEIATKAMRNLSQAQADKARAILAKYAEVEFDTDAINAEGVDSSPARQRARLRLQMRNVIGLTGSFGGHGLRLGRG